MVVRAAMATVAAMLFMLGVIYFLLIRVQGRVESFDGRIPLVHGCAHFCHSLGSHGTHFVDAIRGGEFVKFSALLWR